MGVIMSLVLTPPSIAFPMCGFALFWAGACTDLHADGGGRLQLTRLTGDQRSKHKEEEIYIDLNINHKCIKVKLVRIINCRSCIGLTGIDEQ